MRLTQLSYGIHPVLSSGVLEGLSNVAKLEVFLHVEVRFEGRVDHYDFVIFRFITISHFLKLLTVHMLSNDIYTCVIDSEVFLVDNALIFNGNLGNLLKRADIVDFLDCLKSFGGSIYFIEFELALDS